MPYFRTIIRGIERTLIKETGQVQEYPKQRMGYTIQIPGHARMHTMEPGTGRRVFPSVNQNSDGPLKAVFKEGVCYIPDPDTATEKDFLAVKIANKDVAKTILDYLSDENNGLFGIDYEYDPNDRDDYWKNRGKLVEKPLIKEYVGKKEAEKISREIKSATKSKVASSDDSASAVGAAIAEGLQQADMQKRRGRPPGRPPVIHGAKTTQDG